MFVTSRYVIDSDKSKVYHYFTKEEASMKYLHMFFYILLIPTHTIISQEIIHLPEPQTDRGKSLMQTILLRESSRSYNTISLPLQEFSNLLLVGYGINRPVSKKRTVASAMNTQIFVFMFSLKPARSVIIPPLIISSNFIKEIIVR